MNRPIKFRAWDKVNKRWYREDIKWFPLMALFNKNKYSEHLEFCQFTSLTDKNGKEIWEGDVVKDNIGVGFVDFISPSFVMVYKNGHTFFLGGGFLYTDIDNELAESEVIGNIYENSELLKESK